MKPGTPHRMECCGCKATWDDFLGAYGMRFGLGCPFCKSLYWKVLHRVS